MARREPSGENAKACTRSDKCDDNLPKLLLDETTIAREWPSVVGFVRTSCSAGPAAAKKIEALKAKILGTLQHDPRLAHVRDPLANPWRRVKDAVAEFAEHQKVLSLLDFVRLCENAEASEAITDEDEQRGLLQLLHNLGVIVAHGRPGREYVGSPAKVLLEDIILWGGRYLRLLVSKFLGHGLIHGQHHRGHRIYREARSDPVEFDIFEGNLEIP